jgi:hypothetical protein
VGRSETGGRETVKDTNLAGPGNISEPCTVRKNTGFIPQRDDTWQAQSKLPDTNCMGYYFPLEKGFVSGIEPFSSVGRVTKPFPA